MSMWFRFYETALDDPKVQSLTGEQFKGWVNILCLAKRHDGALPSHKDIAFALRKSGPDTTKLLDVLVSTCLLDHDETGLRPHNWNIRQYKSDVSTERVKRFRQRSETVSETPSETETETETEKNPLKPPKGASKRRGTVIDPEWAPTEDLLEYATAQNCVDPRDTFERFRLHHASKGTLHKDWTMAAQYWCRNEKNFRRNGSGKGENDPWAGVQ